MKLFEYFYIDFVQDKVYSINGKEIGRIKFNLLEGVELRGMSAIDLLTLAGQFGWEAAGICNIGDSNRWRVLMKHGQQAASARTRKA